MSTQRSPALRLLTPARHTWLSSSFSVKSFTTTGTQRPGKSIAWPCFVMYSWKGGKKRMREEKKDRKETEDKR